MKLTCYDSYVVFDKLCGEFESHMAKGSTSRRIILMKKKAPYEIMLVIDNSNMVISGGKQCAFGDLLSLGVKEL
jgi:hypothetical protein